MKASTMTFRPAGRSSGLVFWVRKMVRMAHKTTVWYGTATVLALVVLALQPGLRGSAESWLYGLLHERKVASTGLDIQPQAHERATAINWLDLTEEQAAVAYWLSKKYRVAPEPLGALVAQAYTLGERYRLDPTLILSVVAIESGFNPFAQSAVGAQGLMQVMTTVHEEKYALFGGKHAAFDPLTNLQVGAVILQDCIRRFGGVQPGLRCYVGAAKLPSDGGYAAKVLAEHTRLQKVKADGSRGLPARYREQLRARAREMAAGTPNSQKLAQRAAPDSAAKAS